MTVHLFAGPTLAGRDVLSILPSSVVHPPVAHGDLLRLGLGRDDVVVIIDGFYHQRASVRHKEILALLASGVMVVGCASMGALRAAELAEYGMIGNGAVYRMYRDGVLEADDEVAVAHSPAPDYRCFSVPLVVVRHAVGAAARAGLIDEAEAVSVIDLARDLHYTQRSWQAMRRAAGLADSMGDTVARLLKFVDADPAAIDIKAADALDTLRKVANGEFPGGRHGAEWQVSRGWRNRHVDEWQTEFAVSAVGGVHVGHGAIIRYQQLYLRDFPARWQRFALTRIVGTTMPEAELAGSALAKAAHCGLDAAAMTDARLRHWLTEREMAELAADQMLLRVLVRSYRPLRPTHDLAGDQPDLVEDSVARRMVAEATTVNAEVASWGGKQSIDHIKPAALLAHLKQTWRLDGADEATLLAAARDRGFPSIDDAADAARGYFLHKNFLREPSEASRVRS